MGVLGSGTVSLHQPSAHKQAETDLFFRFHLQTCKHCYWNDYKANVNDCIPTFSLSTRQLERCCGGLQTGYSYCDIIPDIFTQTLLGILQDNIALSRSRYNEQ